MVSAQIYLLLVLLMLIIPAQAISYAGTLTASECKACKYHQLICTSIVQLDFSIQISLRMISIKTLKLSSVVRRNGDRNPENVMFSSTHNHSLFPTMRIKPTTNMSIRCIYRNRYSYHFNIVTVILDNILL